MFSQTSRLLSRMHLLVFIAASMWVSRCRGDCVVQVSGVTDALKSVIINKHNALRAKVANGQQGSLPKASNILEMIWDDTVAGKAQKWANKCEFKHDTAADRDTGNGFTGQNIAYAENQNEDPDWEAIIQLWYDEVSKFNLNAIDKYYFDGSVAHFTQIIWAKTYKVGCGYVRYLKDSNYYHLYGCDYLPGGNIIDQTIYERGEPCSACDQCSQSVPGLCVAGATAMNSPPLVDFEEFYSSDEETSNTGDNEESNDAEQESSVVPLDERFKKLFK